MARSVASKAYQLIESGSVDFDRISFNKLIATVVTKDKKGQNKIHTVTVWRDGHYACTCVNFMYSKSEHLILWGDANSRPVRIKPECKHALAVKLSYEYRQWIRMIEVPTEKGWALRINEAVKEVKVRSLEQEFNKDKLLPKVRAPILVRARRRIPFDKIFD